MQKNDDTIILPFSYNIEVNIIIKITFTAKASNIR